MLVGDRKNPERTVQLMQDYHFFGPLDNLNRKEPDRENVDIRNTMHIGTINITQVEIVQEHFCRVGCIGRPLPWGRGSPGSSPLPSIFRTGYADSLICFFPGTRN